MLVNSKKILLEAKRGNYAVPAPDFLDLDSLDLDFQGLGFLEFLLFHLLFSIVVFQKMD